ERQLPPASCALFDLRCTRIDSGSTPMTAAQKPRSSSRFWSAWYWMQHEIGLCVSRRSHAAATAMTAGSELAMLSSPRRRLYPLGDVQSDEVTEARLVDELVVLRGPLRIPVLPELPVLGLHCPVALPLTRVTAPRPVQRQVLDP